MLRLWVLVQKPPHRDAFYFRFFFFFSSSCTNSTSFTDPILQFPGGKKKRVIWSDKLNHRGAGGIFHSAPRPVMLIPFDWGFSLTEDSGNIPRSSAREGFFVYPECSHYQHFVIYNKWQPCTGECNMFYTHHVKNRYSACLKYALEINTCASSRRSR